MTHVPLLNIMSENSTEGHPYVQPVGMTLIPIKHRPNQPKPMELYGQMLLQGNFEPVIRTMIQEKWVKSEERAIECIHAFLQWMATGALVHERIYLMFHGCVDKAFHAAILNTKWYQGFCNEHIGCYVHHDPLDKREADDVVSKGGIQFTVNKLVNAFGDKLHPELMKWVILSDKQKLGVSNVSCVCNGA